MSAFSEEWEDCTTTYFVGAKIGDGSDPWPSMVDIYAVELEGSITSDDARSLAAMLVRAADACDASTKELRNA